MYTYQKVNDNTLSISKESTLTTVETYTYEDLLNNKTNLEDKKAAMIKDIDNKIATIQESIDEADKLGITLKVVV